MKARGRKPAPLHGRGEIRADAIYPVQALLRRLGISRNTLSSLRRRGLPVRDLGRRCSLIDGAELLAFLRAEWAANSDHCSNDPMAGPGNTETLCETVPANNTQGEVKAC